MTDNANIIFCGGGRRMTPKLVSAKEIDAAIVEVERAVSVEKANLLRNHIRALEARLAAYELGDEDRPLDD